MRFASRHADVMTAIRTTGDIPDEAAFEAIIAAFGAQFRPTGGVVGSEPDAEGQGAANAATVDSATTLPEQDITRDA